VERGDDARLNPGTPAAELVEVVRLGQVRGEDYKHRLADRLSDLVKLERRDGK
jgi:hypothetical protein